jgi:hypothetical protein
VAGSLNPGSFSPATRIPTLGEDDLRSSTRSASFPGPPRFNAGRPDSFKPRRLHLTACKSRTHQRPSYCVCGPCVRIRRWQASRLGSLTAGLKNTHAAQSAPATAAVAAIEFHRLIRCNSLTIVSMLSGTSITADRAKMLQPRSRTAGQPFQRSYRWRSCSLTDPSLDPNQNGRGNTGQYGDGSP